MFWALQSLKGLNCIILLSPRVKFSSVSAPGCILSPLWCRSPFKASGTSGKGLGHSLVVKNVPSNAGDAGSIPGGELDPMCHGAITQLKATAEAHILQPDWAHALQQEKAYTPQWRPNAEKRERIQEGDSPYLQLLCSSQFPNHTHVNMWSLLSCVRLFEIPWTVPTRLLCPWDSQARILAWVVISFSRGSSPPRDWTPVSCIAGRFFTVFTQFQSSWLWGGLRSVRVSFQWDERQASTLRGSDWNRLSVAILPLRSLCSQHSREQPAPPWNSFPSITPSGSSSIPRNTTHFMAAHSYTIPSCWALGVHKTYSFQSLGPLGTLNTSFLNREPCFSKAPLLQITWEMLAHIQWCQLLLGSGNR